MGWIALTDNQLSLSLPLSRTQKHPVNDIMKTRKAEVPDQEQDLHVHQNVPAQGVVTQRGQKPISAVSQFPILQSDCNPGQGIHLHSQQPNKLDPNSSPTI